MANVHITNLYGLVQTSTALAAQNLVANVARNMGFNEIGVYGYPMSVDSPSELRARMDGILASLGFGDIVIFQYPTWNDLEFDTKLINKIKAYAGVKVIIFIHDVIPFMFEPNKGLLPRIVSDLNLADLIIAPTQKMVDELRAGGLTVEKVVLQELWDYPDASYLKKPQLQKYINFIGKPEKFEFTKEWNYEVPLHLYAKDDGEVAWSELNVEMEGWKYQSELVTSLSAGGFGLTWTEDPYTFEYLTKCVSFKVGTYMAAGIPLIVHKKFSSAPIIEKNGLGLTVNSLEEAVDLVKNMSDDTYLGYVKNVREFGYLIRNGYFTKRALTEAIVKVLEK